MTPSFLARDWFLRRRLFIVATAALLLLVLALWPISFSTGRIFFVDTGSRNMSVSFCHGKITVAAWNTPSKGRFELGWDGTTTAWDAYDNLWFGSETAWRFMGFDGGNSTGFGRFFSVPFWFLAFCLAALLAYVVRIFRRKAS